MQIKLKIAKETYEKGYDCVYETTTERLKEAKALPKTTAAEKEFRKEEIEKAKNAISAKKTADKYYPNGIKEFDISTFDTLFSKDDDLDIRITEAYKAVNAAKKNKEDTTELKAEITMLKAERQKVKKLIDQTNKEYTRFTNASIPYINARKLIVQAENYGHIDEISEMYDAAKERSEAADRKAHEEEEKLLAEKKAEKEIIKAEKRKK